MTSSLRVALLAATALLLALPLEAQTTSRRAPDTITTRSGLRYVVTQTAKKGKKVKKGEIVMAHYTGRFLDGTVFDSSRERNQPFAFTLGKGEVIKGWDEAFALLRVGERATLIIPPALAYGSVERGPIPANSTLLFEVELVGVRKKGFVDLFRKTLESSGIESAVALYERQKKKGFEEYYMGEGQFNTLGYQYLQSGATDEAIATFKVNVDAFPASANTYDSLGEAYMAAGEKELAIRNYQRSLELDPSNSNAVEMLRRMGVGQ